MMGNLSCGLVNPETPSLADRVDVSNADFGIELFIVSTKMVGCFLGNHF